MASPPQTLTLLVELALAEDLDAAGDITAAASVPVGRQAEARLVAKEAGVLAGMAVARNCFQQLDAKASFAQAKEDGAQLAAGEVFLRVIGDARALLAAERTALNFLQRLSGIATTTRRYVDAVAGTGVQILDTRKTTPLLRDLEKAAVLTGGGVNHRHGLHDQILLKENHFALSGQDYLSVVQAAVASSTAPVIAEARDMQEALQAVQGGAAVVLLDNFALPGPLTEAVQALRKAAAQAGGQVSLEASGGIDLRSVAAVAACGVDRISIGALTHSVRALDLSMLMEAVA